MRSTTVSDGDFVPRSYAESASWDVPEWRDPASCVSPRATWAACTPVRSRYHYRKIHDARILPTFEVVAIPTARAHAYGLLRTILSDAVQRRLIDQDAGRSSVPATPSVRSGLGRPATLPQPEARPR